MPLNEATVHYMSGTFGGVCGVLAGHPLDTIKVRLQVQRLYGGSPSVFMAAKEVMGAEGIRGLYRGLTPPLAAEAIINSFLFGTYNLALNTVRSHANDDMSRLPALSHVFIAGCVGGLPAACCNSPLELIKARIQVQSLRYSGVAYGPIDCARQTIRHYGFLNLFTGLSVTLIRDVPAYGLYFAVYEFFKQRFLTPRHGDPPMSKSREFGVQVMGGGMAGVAAWAFTYPFDVIKTRLQTQHLADLDSDGARASASSGRYRGVWDCIVKCRREEGLRVFTRGLLPTLVKAFPTNAAIFCGYEFMKKLLSQEMVSTDPVIPQEQT